jgi:hypothetical protein
LKKENLDSKLSFFTASFSNEAAENYTSLNQLFKDGYIADKFPNKILHALQDGQKQSTEITLAECTNQDGHLHYREKKYVPNYNPLRLPIIQDHHDTPAAGHPRHDQTFDLISRGYYWPGMKEAIGQFVRNCHTCRRSKPVNHTTHGVLRPLPIPN